MAMTMMDWINANVLGNTITLNEFTNMMRSGDPEQREEAVERMLAAGGYDNLD